MTLSLEEKVGQMMCVGFEGLTPPAHVLDWIAAGRIGGVILFAGNVESPQQLADLVGALHAAAPRPLLISIDQEGGTVARLRQGFTESPGAMALGAADSDDLAEDVSAALAAELRALGVNWNYAPVVDLTHDIDNPSVGTRSPGSDAARVSRLVAAEIRGFQRGGVAATAKHFPGLGNTPVDTHRALAVIEGPLDYLWTHDLVPFRAAVAAGVATVMVSHVKFPALDAEHPATLSRPIVQGLLRDEIGFDGVICTDCMTMRAIADHYGAGESAVLAALAGEDMILFSHYPVMQTQAYDAVLAGAQEGRIPEALIDRAVARVLALKERYAVGEPLRPEAIRAADHLAVMRRAARAGTVALKMGGALPIRPDDARRVGLVEFVPAMDSRAMGIEAGRSRLLARLSEQVAGLDAVALLVDENAGDAVERARAIAAGVDVLVVATRSAHLWPAQRELAQALLDAARASVLVCLRNPYDAAVLSGANSLLCTCGDSAPSLEAAVDALTGAFTPSGRLPVPLEMPI